MLDRALTVKYAVLGPIELYDGEQTLPLGGPRQVTLLALLLVHANRALSSDELSDTMWQERTSTAADKRLQMAIARLRRVLDRDGGGRRDSALQTVGGGYRLRVDMDELDAHVFEARMQRGCAALEAGEAASARALLREALSLWRGPALADVAYAEFAQNEIRRLEELRLTTLEARVEAELKLGMHAQLIGELEAAIANHPTRERLCGQLMLAYYRCGRQSNALDVYRRVQLRLDTEFGLQPSPTLAALQRDILEQARSLQLDELLLRRAARTAIPAPDLPAGLTSLASTALVGRATERARLAEIVRTTQRGERRIACFAGEPGVGKTRLAAATVLEAHTTGFAVGWGASIEGLRPPYGAWIQALSELVDRAPSDVLAQHVASHGGELARLVRRLERRAGPVPAPQRSDPETERYLLFAAVAGLLTALCERAPVAIGLDDLQWADAESLELLRYVGTTTATSLPLLIVVTYRECELHSRHPLGGVLADLHRVPGVEQFALGGLDVNEVAELMTSRTGRYAGLEGRRLATEITQETGGNPFFAGEILRHLHESGAVSSDAAGRWHVRGSVAELDLPRTVREVITWRVQRLGAAAEAALGTAAVIGQTFDLGLLECLVDIEDPLAVLEAATQSALIEPSEVPGRYAFVHALINHTLYDGLSAARRARLHRRVAEALEAVVGAPPGQLAHHWARCGIPGQLPTAAYHARLAGERALNQLAPDEALGWFTRALALLRGQDAGDDERCDILIGLGEAKRRTGDSTFRHNLIAAGRIAARLDDHDRLTRAALANTFGPLGAAGKRDRLRVEALEHALQLVADDWPYRPRMTAILGRELYYGGQPGPGAHLSVVALEHARRRGDRHELARVMALTVSISPIASLEAHAALVHELTELTARVGDPELRFLAANAEFLHGMHSGDPVSLEDGVQEMLGQAAAIEQPIMRWTALWAHSAHRTLAGDLAGGEALTLQAAAAARAQQRPQGLIVTFGQLLGIRTEQDRLGEVREQLAFLTARNRRMPILHLAHGFIDAETGELDGARAVLDAAADTGFQFPFDRTLAFNLARCADIALRLEAVEPARELYDRLLPYREHVATAAGLSSRGSIELNLGRLASLLGRFSLADRHLARAEQVHARLRAPLLQARTALAHGESLLARGSAPSLAAGPLDEALRLARRHGSVAIEREVGMLSGSQRRLTAC